MADYDNNNRGALFVNNKKTEGSKQPDRTGTINIEGVEYFLDGWIKKSQAGAAFMSLSVKRKEVQPGQKSAQHNAPSKPAAPASGFDDFDEQPF